MPYPEFIAALEPSNVPPRRCPVPRARASRRYLIVKMWALGDLLMATPLVAALRDADPDCHITWLVHRHNREAVDANPDVDAVIVWDTDYWKDLLCQRWKKMLHPRRFLGIPWLRQALRLRRQLRPLGIDVFISMHPELMPTLLRGVAAGHAIGVFEAEPHASRLLRCERLYRDVYTRSDALPHHTDEYLLPLRGLGLPSPAEKRMTLGYTAEDERAVREFLAARGVADSERLVVLAPATTWESKHWPADRYARLADALAAAHDCRVVLVGASGEAPTVGRVAGRMRAAPVTAVGDLGIRQLAALIGRASLLVSGDAGPMHMAAALGTPYVGIFGPTAPERYAPLAGRGVTLARPVPCGPCGLMQCPNPGADHLLCQSLITVEDVLAACRSLLRAEAVPA